LKEESGSEHLCLCALCEENLEEGLFTGDFERRMKGGVEVERLSLRELCEVNLEGRLLYWGP